MYSKILMTTSTAANLTSLVSDVVLLLTGASDFSTLSSTVDKVNSTLITTVPAGWTLVGDYSVAGGKVISAPCSESNPQLKYLAVYPANGTINFLLGEGYNSTTKALINSVLLQSYLVNGASGYCVLPSTTKALYISASARHVIVMPMLDTTAGTVGDFAGVFEHTRKDMWNTTATGYLPAVQTPALSGLAQHFITYGLATANQYMQHTRIIYETMSTTYPASQTFSAICTPWGSLYDNSSGSLAAAQGITGVSSSMGIDSTLTKVHQMIPFGVSRPSARFLGGDISSLCGIYITTAGFGANLDSFTYNSINYDLWKYSTFTLAVRRT